MNKRCIIYMSALFLVVSVTHGSLWDPPVQNESFEYPVLNIGSWSQSIDDWFEESYWGSYIQYESTDIPVTPYGNQWAGGAGSRGDATGLYQQIGTWDANIDYTISLLMGHRLNYDYGDFTISLWAGGNVGLAWDEVLMVDTGATQIASITFNPFETLPPDEIAVSEESVVLNTGTAFSYGDPLWVMFSVEGGDQAFYDMIRIAARDVASDPSPADFAEFIVRTPTLSWTAPVNYAPTSYDVSYGIDPNCDTTITGLGSPSCTITEELDWATRYYWKVTSYDGGTAHAGQVWTFTVTPEWAVVLTDPVGVTVAAGDTAEFTVSGLNIEGYQWMKNGFDIVDGDGILGATTGTLSISGVDINDEGTYSCRLINHVADAVSEGAYLWTERQVGYWRFDGDFTDDIDGRTGVVSTGDPNFVTEGINGGCYKFFGDEYIEIADSAEFYNFYPNGFTVSCWMKPTDGAGWGGLVSKQEQVWPYVGWVLYRSGAFGVASLRGVDDLYGGTSLVDGNWHLVIMHYNADDGVLRVSVDGKTDAMTSVEVELALTDRPLAIGTDDPIDGTALFKGLVDEVKIWTYPLSLEEIANLYTEFVPGGDFCMEGPAFDFNGDCVVGLNDFVDLAASWLECNYIPESECGI